MRRLWLISLVLLAITGCATQAPNVGSLPAADTWSLEGKLGIKSRVNSGNLGLHWAQAGPSFTINFYGPLGISVGQITGDATSAVLDLPNELPQRAGSADELAQLILGYPVPVEPLTWWVRGLPAPGKSVKTEDGFEQLGWQIQVLRQDESGPRKIQLQRREFQLLLVIKTWQY